MKKFGAKFLLLGLLAGLLTGCGQSDAAYLKDMDESKAVTVGEYKGIEITVSKIAVSDEDVDVFVEELRANTPIPTEITGPAKDGDEVNFDFVGKLDGVAFENGSGTDTTLVLGEGQFIPELEAGMIGIKAGEVKDVPARFPDDYSLNPDLAGKETVFTITMHSVVEYNIVPELTDEHINGLSEGQFPTLADYKAYVKEQFTLQLENERDNLLAEAVLANCKFKKIPAAYLARLNAQVTTNLTMQASQQGMDLNTYLSYNGAVSADKTAEDFVAEQAEQVARRYLAYQVIADTENLNPTESELDEAIDELAAEVGVSAEEYTAMAELDREEFRESKMLEKVGDFIADNAVISAEEAGADEVSSGEVSSDEVSPDEAGADDVTPEEEQ